MAKLDLSAKTTASWRERLPEDMHVLVTGDVRFDRESELVALGQELETTSPRRLGDLIKANEGLLIEAGRATFVRVMVYAINRSQPDFSGMSTLLAEDGEESGDGGCSRYATLYRDLFETASKICRSRIVRAASDRKVVSAIDAGVREFGASMGMSQSGGM